MAQGYWEAAALLVTKLGERPLAQKDSLRRQTVETKKQIEKFLASLEPKSRAQV